MERTMEIRGSQFVQQTAAMDHQNMGGRSCTTSLEGCQHSHHPQKGDRTECGNYRGISHSRHDLLSTTTTGKVHRAGSTFVYCLCRFHEGNRHRWEDWTMAAQLQSTDSESILNGTINAN